MDQVLFASASDIVVGAIVGGVCLFAFLYVIGKREMERKAKEKEDRPVIELPRREPESERRYYIIRFRTWWFE